MPFLPFDSPASMGTQLVVTLGPASLPSTRALAEAGATGFRLNASHFTPATLREATDRVRKDLPKAPLIVDLQGAKMRIGGIAEKLVRSGDVVWFSLIPRADAILLPHPELFGAAREGLTLSCDDGRMRFRIMGVDEDRIESMALESGVLRPRKGINLVEHPVRLTGLTPTDLAACEAAGDVSDWAYSFMEDGREAAWLTSRLGECTIIGKLERKEALDNLDAIAQRVNAMWVCRGDMGEQLGLSHMAHWISEFDPTRHETPVLMAGQVLHSLASSREINRSEVCHLYDLLTRGYAGFVLSDETAVGIDPVYAVQRASDLISALQGNLPLTHARPVAHPSDRAEHGRRRRTRS